MTNLVAPEQELRCRGSEHSPELMELSGREAMLGDGLVIRRLLPNRRLRLVGPWCFLDHFGPLELAPDDPGMRVGPHPHTGLQTVTWVVEGEILHRDSLGYRQIIRPGQLNLMTAGRGISHSEETPKNHGPRLHGVQLWVGLPSAHADAEPAFEHYASLPVVERDGMRCTVFMGEALGETSPAITFSPMVGMEIVIKASGARELPLRLDFEHALMLVEGAASIGEEMELSTGRIYDLGRHRASVPVSADGRARLILVGGEPLGEELILWWNFVGRSHEEIARARAEWEAGERFGEVRGYDGDRLPAPELPTRLRPR